MAEPQQDMTFSPAMREALSRIGADPDDPDVVDVARAIAVKACDEFGRQVGRRR